MCKKVSDFGKTVDSLYNDIGFFHIIVLYVWEDLLGGDKKITIVLDWIEILFSEDHHSLITTIILKISKPFKEYIEQHFTTFFISSL